MNKEEKDDPVKKDIIRCHQLMSRIENVIENLGQLYDSTLNLAIYLHRKQKQKERPD